MIDKYRFTISVLGGPETMETMNKLMEISSRIEHLENAAEWIAKETIHTDNSVSQTSTLICVLADDLREKVCQLVKELERISYMEKMH